MSPKFELAAILMYLTMWPVTARNAVVFSAVVIDRLSVERGLNDGLSRMKGNFQVRF